MINEVWKDINGYEELYQVSNFGRIKSLPRLTKNKNCSYYTKEKIYNGSYNVDGYKTFTINKKQKYIHRLVLEAFIPNPNNYPCVNHIDCKRDNNNIENLEWCSFKQNTEHMIKLKRNVRTKKWLIRLKSSQIKKNGKKVVRIDCFGNKKVYNYINEVKKDGFNPGCVCNCCKKIDGWNTHQGYIWEYYDRK